MNIKGIIAAIIIGLFAIVGGTVAIKCIEIIPEGSVGVVYTYANGAQDDTLDAGWHFIGFFEKVKEYPIGQQQLVLSNDPEDYNDKNHADWHVDAPANGGMVSLNMTVNYNFMADRVVDLYKKFKGMDGEAIVESRVQNSIIAYIKEVTPRYSVMEIYSEKTAEVNEAITEHLNNRLSQEYGIQVSSALIIKTSLNETLMAKIQAKEEAKQDAEKAELDRQTAIAQAEVTKANAEAAAEVAKIQAEADADVAKIKAEAEAEQLVIKANSQAESTRVKADAEAEAIRKKTEALTDEYVDYVIAENWNGELPKIQSGAGGSMIMDVGNVLEESAE